MIFHLLEKGILDYFEKGYFVCPKKLVLQENIVLHH